MTSLRSLIAQCCRCGVAQWVLTPCMQHTPLDRILRASGSLVLHSADTNAGAAGFALGLLLARAQHPVALVTNDWDATKSALHDARIRNLPLLVVIPASGPSPEDGIEDWDRTGPYVHYLDPSLMDAETDGREYDFSPAPVLAPRYPRPKVGDLARTLRCDMFKGLVLMLGELAPEERDPAMWIAETLKAPVIADPGSGLREELASLALHESPSWLPSDPPGTVLQIGALPLSTFWKQLEDLSQTVVYAITRQEDYGLSRPVHLIRSSVEDAVHALGDIHPVGDPCDLMRTSRKYRGKIEELLISLEDSRPALLRALSNVAAYADAVYLPSALMLAEWNRFAQWQVATPCTGNAGNIHPLACFAGLSCGLGDSWAVFDAKDAVALPEEACFTSLPPSERKVLAFLGTGEENRTVLPDWTARQGGTFIRIASAFDLDRFDELPPDGLCVIEIAADSGQTSQFNKLITPTPQ